jgi:hypothetical protein
MLLFCYAQCPRYLLHIIFLSPSILQHRSFNIIVCHLACCQVILFVFSRGLVFLQWFDILPLLSWGVGL